MSSVENWTPFDSLSDDNWSGSDGDIDDAQFREHLQAIPTATEDHQSAFLRTTFDSYFLHFAKPNKTGHTVFSSQVPPLSAEEYPSAVKSAAADYQLNHPLSDSLQGLFLSHFSRFCLELDEGFNLIFYGFGSKRALLNQFATRACSKLGHVVVVNGSHPKSSLKDLLATIETISGLQAVPLSTSSPESQISRICEFFAPLNERPPLYILIHNIDAQAFCTVKAKWCLSALASCPRIHLVASVDHIHAPLLWSLSEASTRSPADAGFSTSLPLRGFSWLWHDLTTFASYDHELAHVDRGSFSGASLQPGGRRARDSQVTSAGGGSTAMTETAAQHILASVTQKAKRLFALIATKQLAIMEDDEDAAVGDFQRFALTYDALFTSARDNFIATNDAALKSLLGEFRDHSLVVSSGSGTAEVLWIPLRKERLEKVFRALQVD